MTSGEIGFRRATNVSRETFDRLSVFATLLTKWNPKINLVAHSTISELWSRHMLDSYQVFELRPPKARSWADFGSGGGFPGAVVAIAAEAAAPNLSVTLVESDQRKATFLRAVARETKVRFTVISERAEALEPLCADVVSARALAPLTNLLELAGHHLAPGGTALFPKGASVDKEIATALESRRFHCESHESQTDKDAVILKIGDIERA